MDLEEEGISKEYKLRSISLTFLFFNTLRVCSFKECMGLVTLVTTFKCKKKKHFGLTVR